MRKLIIVVIIFANTLLAGIVLPGCGQKRPDVKDIGLISSVGVAYQENKFVVTVQAIKPSSVRENKPDAIIVEESTGNTVLESLQDLIITLGRKPVWTHLSVLVFAEESAKEGVLPLLDFFYRDIEPRLSMLPVISADNLKDLFEVNSKLGGLPADQINNSLEAESVLNKAVRVEFHDFLEGLMEPYLDPYLPLVHKKGQELQIYGTAIFKGDKLVETLTPNETKGMLRVLDKIENGTEIIRMKDGEKPIFITLGVNSSQTKVKSEIADKNKIIIEINEVCYISGITGAFILNEDKLKEIEKTYREFIQGEVEGAVMKIQKSNSNVLGFAQVINRQDKAYWQEIKDQWEKLNPELEIEIKVQVKVSNNQLSKNNFYK